jgi:hypothetical protein
VAIVSEEYPRERTSRDDFANIQRVIGRLVDELPEEGFTPRLVDSYWSKGAAIMVATTNRQKSGYPPMHLAW